ncbi:MAG TPA: septum formation initiator family protein [Solirubrobacteraceae bacterium]|nr:septum formation initiator family protein [Solirubrobacteraceae bacterium]
MSPARSHASARASAGARSAPRTTPTRPGARTTPGFQPRHVRSRAPLSRIRWDRAARAGMVAVLVLIGYLWISGIASLLHTRAQAERGLAQVHRLAVENRRLLAEEKALHQRGTILDQARSLGMVRQGEQSFILTH